MYVTRIAYSLEAGKSSSVAPWILSGEHFPIWAVGEREKREKRFLYNVARLNEPNVRRRPVLREEMREKEGRRAQSAMLQTKGNGEYDCRGNVPEEKCPTKRWSERAQANVLIPLSRLPLLFYYKHGELKKKKKQKKE